MRTDPGNFPVKQADHTESEVRIPEAVVARNAHGQSLDDAREAFRAGWAVQLREKQEQAARTARLADLTQDLARRIASAGTALGGLLGWALGARRGDLLSWIVITMSLAAVGLVLALAPALVALGGSWIYRRRAERLEREVREMERS